MHSKLLSSDLALFLKSSNKTNNASVKSYTSFSLLRIEWAPDSAGNKLYIKGKCNEFVRINVSKFPQYFTV